MYRNRLLTAPILFHRSILPHCQGQSCLYLIRLYIYLLIELFNSKHIGNLIILFNIFHTWLFQIQCLHWSWFSFKTKASKIFEFLWTSWKFSSGFRFYNLSSQIFRDSIPVSTIISKLSWVFTWRKTLLIMKKSKDIHNQ